MSRAPWITGMPVRLETERFIIRSMRAADIDANYMRWIGDPEIMKNLNTLPIRKSKEEEAKRLGAYDNALTFQLGIFVRDGGALIGFFQVRADRDHKLAETSVVIGDRAWWGRNTVIEARDALVDFLFDRLKMEKVWGLPQARNFPALLNYRKQGFRLEGVLRSHNASAYGGRLDFAVFGMTRQDWLALRAKAAT